MLRLLELIKKWGCVNIPMCVVYSVVELPATCLP
jgi:hypothetical protein